MGGFPNDYRSYMMKFVLHWWKTILQEKITRQIFFLNIYSTLLISLACHCVNDKRNAKFRHFGIALPCLSLYFCCVVLSCNVDQSESVWGWSQLFSPRQSCKYFFFQQTENKKYLHLFRIMIPTEIIGIKRILYANFIKQFSMNWLSIYEFTLNQTQFLSP